MTCISTDTDVPCSPKRPMQPPCTLPSLYFPLNTRSLSVHPMQLLSTLEGDRRRRYIATVVLLKWNGTELRTKTPKGDGLRNGGVGLRTMTNAKRMGEVLEL